MAFAENLRAKPASTLEGVSRFIGLEPALGAAAVNAGGRESAVYEKPRGYSPFDKLSDKLRKGALALYEGERWDLRDFLLQQQRVGWEKKGDGCDAKRWLCVSVLGALPGWLAS